MLLDKLKQRFFEYVDHFYSECDTDNQAFRLKRDHTRRVCRNARMLANKLKISERESLLAEVMALFHDIGRFKQYRIYQTFKDADSENHAALGVSEIKTHSLLEGLAEDEIGLILRAIEYHNALKIPDHIRGRERFFMQLLRDADKLDIWKVFGEYCEVQTKSSTDSVSLGLSDNNRYSDCALKAVCERKIVQMPELKTLNDFKLLQISWVYDLNFVPTMEAMMEKGYIERLYAFLPQTREIEDAFEKVYQYAESVVSFGYGAAVGP